MRPERESDLAAVVVAYLEAMGGDVYQEVACAGGVADIVAKIRRELWIVETKTSLSLALLCQAMERRRAATRVFVAAPYSRNVGDVGRICEELGIGLLVVNAGEDWGSRYGNPHVQERVESRRWNTRPTLVLAPEHKTHAKAGTAEGGRWTPFRNTAEQLVRLVRDQPGITLKAAIDLIKHHYASSQSARGTLAARIEEGLIPGVRLDRSTKGAMRLQPTEAA